MKLVKVSDLFEVHYGVNLELNKLKKTNSKDGINFVSRTAKNNGVSAVVERIKGLDPIPAGMLTVAGGGSVLETFLQPKPFYSGRDLYYLKSIVDMTDQEKLFYCMCIKANKYKYNYGRQANRTLKDILIPDLSEIPNEVRKVDLNKFNNAAKAIQQDVLDLYKRDWKKFRYDEIFEIKKGYYNKKPPVSNNKLDIPFIGATDKNNGITAYIEYINLKRYSKTGVIDENELINNKIFKGNCITVSNNGSVGEAFYQEKEFTCSHDVNPLYLLNYELNKYIAMFLCALIKKEKYRWSYGRKWRPIRMPSSIIELPVDEKGNPDWQFMEDYIKTIPYSSSI